MKSFDVDIKKSAGAYEPLPAGGYVAKILNAEVVQYNWGSALVVSFDVAEGEYRSFFANQYRESTSEDKKWKGNYRLTIPDENNQYYEGQKRAFGNFIACVEESNSGWHWSWNESELKGKMVGILVRNYEYDINGRRGWSTEACSAVSVDDVRDKAFKIPKDRQLKQKTNQPTDLSHLPTFNQDDDLPF